MKDIEYLKKYYDGNIEEAKARLENGEPVQYIVGNVDFYGNKIIVNKNVLIPRFETELLIEKTLSKIDKNKKMDIIDLGTGSGCIAITLKKLLDCNIDAMDISSKALELAKQNAIINNVDINFIEGDMLNPLNKKYDLIISNPPYISEDEEIEEIVYNNEPHVALYAKDKGMYLYKEFIKKSKDYLKDNGLMAFEIGYLQGKELKEYALNYYNNVEIEKDLSGKDRYLFIKK